MSKQYYAVKDASGHWAVRIYGESRRTVMTMTQMQFDSFCVKNEVIISHEIIDQKAFEEACYMASLAFSRTTTRVSPESYWEAGNLALREAYGV